MLKLFTTALVLTGFLLSANDSDAFGRRRRARSSCAQPAPCYVQPAPCMTQQPCPNVVYGPGGPNYQQTCYGGQMVATPFDQSYVMSSPPCAGTYATATQVLEPIAR